MSEFKPTIRVSFEYAPGEVLGSARQMSGLILRDALVPIDHSGARSDAMSVALCTPMRDRLRIRHAREEAATMVSREVAALFLKLLASKDTKMGYPVDD